MLYFSIPIYTNRKNTNTTWQGKVGFSFALKKIYRNKFNFLIDIFAHNETQCINWKIISSGFSFQNLFHILQLIWVFLFTKTADAHKYSYSHINTHLVLASALRQQCKYNIKIHLYKIQQHLFCTINPHACLVVADI